MANPLRATRGRKRVKKKADEAQEPISAPHIQKVPLTDDQLWNDLKDNFGVPFPRYPLCQDHSAPFLFLADLYFERHTDDCVVHANRKGFKSLSTAALISYAMRDAPFPMKILNLGGNEEQAKRVLEYASEFWRRWPRAGEYVAPSGIQKQNIFSRRGSHAKIVAASLKNVHGPAVHWLIIDEVDCFDERERGAGRGQTEASVQDAGDLHLNPIIMGAMSTMSTDAEDRRAGRLVFLSTFHNPMGTMSKLIDHREELGLRLYDWCFLDTTEQCPATWDCKGAVGSLVRDMVIMRRDKEARYSQDFVTAQARLSELEAKCPIIEFCQGALKNGRGVFRLRDVFKMRKRLGREAFAFYWACKRPRMKGAVLDTQEVEDALVDGLEIEPGLHTAIAVDPGWAETAAQVWQIERKCVGEDEYEICRLTDARTWRERPPTEKLNELESMYIQLGCSEIYSDAAAREFNESLMERGLNVIPVAFTNQKEGTIDTIRAALATGRLLINSRLAIVVKEVKGWRRTNSGAIIKKEDHHPDAIVVFFAGHRPSAGAGSGPTSIVVKKQKANNSSLLGVTGKRFEEPGLPYDIGEGPMMKRALNGPLGTGSGYGGR